MLIKPFRTTYLSIVLTTLLWYKDSRANKHVTQLCDHKCDSPMSNSSYLFEWCENEGFNVSGRCCIDHEGGSHTKKIITNSSVVGVSLRDCDINQLSHLLLGFTNLSVVLLDENPLTNSTAAPEDFRGLIHLNYLSLPSGIACPGGGDSWDYIEYDSNMTVCQNRTNLCIVLRARNQTCPTHSHCVDLGPGLRECWCTDDHHGYKCLRKGRFPIILFCSLTGGLTIFLSLLLWCTQRRHVKKE